MLTCDVYNAMSNSLVTPNSSRFSANWSYAPIWKLLSSRVTRSSRSVRNPKLLYTCTLHTEIT